MVKFPQYHAVIDPAVIKMKERPVSLQMALQMEQVERAPTIKYFDAQTGSFGSSLSFVVPAFSARFSKAPKLFGPAKPFLIACILKTKKRAGIKLCMKDNFIHVKNM